MATFRPVSMLIGHLPLFPCIDVIRSECMMQLNPPGFEIVHETCHMYDGMVSWLNCAGALVDPSWNRSKLCWAVG